MSQNKNKDRHPNGRGGLNGFMNRRVSFQSFVQCRTTKRHNAGAFFQYYSSGRNGFDRKFFSRARHFNNVANVDVINWIHLATNYQIICCCCVIHKKLFSGSYHQIPRLFQRGAFGLLGLFNMVLMFPIFLVIFPTLLFWLNTLCPIVLR